MKESLYWRYRHGIAYTIGGKVSGAVISKGTRSLLPPSFSTQPYSPHGERDGQRRYGKVISCRCHSLSVRNRSRLSSGLVKLPRASGEFLYQGNPLLFLAPHVEHEGLNQRVQSLYTPPLIAGISGGIREGGDRPPASPSRVVHYNKPGALPSRRGDS